MSSRCCFNRLAILLATAAVALPASRSFAQVVDAAAGGPAQAAPDIDTSEYTFAGEVNADGTLIRSGASEEDYPTLKLNKGTRLTVVGMRNDWLKIVPPEGSFCLVPQAFVNKRGNDAVGRVETKATIRVGSALTNSKFKVPMQLDPGAEIQIIGDLEEYYKIVPPKGVYVYVDKKFVNPVKRLDVAGGTTPPPNGATPPAVASGTITTPPDVAGATPAGTDKPAGVADATRPPQPGAPDTSTFHVKGVAAPDAIAGPTTQNVAAVDQIRELQEKLAGVEDRYAAASKLEIPERPYDALLTDYQALLANAALPQNARRVAEYRVTSLKLQKQTADQLVATRKSQAELAAKQQQLQDEQAKMQQTLAASQIKRYAAVGKLMTSTLLAGGQPLYRLVDPANGRTVVYVRPAAGKTVAGGLNQFVAVTGAVVKDDAMKITYVTPDAFEAVDANLVNRKIFADYSPPSMATANLTTTDAGGQ